MPQADDEEGEEEDSQNDEEEAEEEGEEGEEEVLPENRNGVWGITDILGRRSCKPTWSISNPSILIVPLPGTFSTSLKNAPTKVDLPAPVRPTHPTLDPGVIEKVRDFSTGAKSCR